MLKGIIDNIETVDENVRGFYTKGDDNLYRLQVEGFIPEQDVNGLKKALDETKSGRDEFKSKFKPFEDLGLTNANEIQEKLSLLETLQQLDPKKEADRLAQIKIDEALREKSQEWKSQTDEWKSKSGELQGELRSLRIDNAVSNVIHRTEGNPLILSAIIERNIRMKDDNKTIYVIDPVTGGPLYDTNTGKEKTLEEYVLSLRANPEYGACFKGTGNSGSGAPQNQGFKGSDGKIRISSKLNARELGKYQKEIAAGNVVFTD